MKVYVAGQLADTAAVTAAQQQILAAGHTLTHDWTQDPCFTEKYASCPQIGRHRPDRPRGCHGR